MRELSSSIIRLYEERNALHFKHKKLVEFIALPAFTHLSQVQRELLLTQQAAMAVYLKTLNVRIDDLNKKV